MLYLLLIYYRVLLRLLLKQRKRWLVLRELCSILKVLPEKTPAVVVVAVVAVVAVVRIAKSVMNGIMLRVGHEFLL